MSTMTAVTEGLLIDGARTESSDRQTFDVFDPSTGERLATVAKATKGDIDRAVAHLADVVTHLRATAPLPAATAGARG